MELFLQVFKKSIIISASTVIESSLDISDVQLGYLGSLVYAGIVALGILGGPLFIRFNPKIIIQTSLFAMMASLCLFTYKY